MRMSKPFFTLSKKVVFEKYAEVNEIADVVSYSSKTNPLVTPLLEEKTDCLFSIHLPSELYNVKDKSRVLFLAQAWDEEYISKLIERGINKFVVDNEPDLEVLLFYLKKNLDVYIEQLFLRIKLKENTIRTEKYFVFGMISSIVNKRIQELSKHNQIKELGVHSHRKTQNIAEWNLEYEYSHMLEKETLQALTYINIGGGLPSTYANTNELVINSIKFKLKELKKFLNKNNMKLVIEPGRFIAAPAGKLHTKILSKYENNLVVNASVYNTDLDALIVPVKLLVEGEVGKGEGEAYVLKGITPCSMDLFRYRVYLKNPQIGEELIFLNAGAYNFSTKFIDLEELETKVIE
jgi:ornithine decarboxylase